ncbi:NarK family nitrate/nitrite MFS transporter [Skermanella mucosa]|uniref:NarK family nitrate/nitrite MFS transporter n=1 Tax=Skermanella mucosa TaxID=1789672 RepID=UPI00192AB51A|nr:NarK family nitrate/nitrite MFS transporter [Skermanella mucosa]UEM18507.1 NarK family nitrate/nitrite MFS transporter [Skermanella mucosa]
MTDQTAVRAPGHVLTDWRPEDAAFWAETGKRAARRNLWISIPALLLSFAVWMVWSVVVVNLPAIGFAFDNGQLFWLAALPGLSGATLRLFYSFMVPIFGGRAWTTLSTASLLLPALGIGIAVQDPATPYSVFLVLALLCGFGGGNFASSMSNISFFFPKAQKGLALGLNAGLGNLGVSVVQFVVPLVITAGIFGTLGGEAQTWAKGDVTKAMWLQNAGFVWVPFIVLSTLAAWFGMNDIADAKASFADQAVIFKRKHNWIMCWLYIGTFGSFIGFSAGFPLLTKIQFPGVDPLAYAFLGPLVGAFSRSVSGGISDRFGGARVTVWVFAAMIAASVGVIFFLGFPDKSVGFWGFLAMFMVLFAASGVGNSSTFQMIPAIFLTLRQRANGTDGVAAVKAAAEASREAAAVLGFTSAIAAFGAFFIPKLFGTSISLTGSPVLALEIFIAFYLSCIVCTWWFYTRKGAEVRC